MIKSINSALRLTHRIIVWFVDSTIMQDDDTQRIRASLETLIDNLMIFDDANKCTDYLHQIHDEQIVLIVDEYNGEQIVRTVLPVSKLHSIYIICSNPSHRPPWASICRSIRCYFVDLASHCDRILMESDEEHHGIGFDVLPPASVSDQSRNRQEATFMYGQLLKQVLTQMSYTEEDMDKMIEFLKEKSSDNKASQDFRQHYTPDKALLYYTTEIFFYSILNTALRTSNVDVIYKMGIFIKDLHKMIVELHKPLKEDEILHLYRGQVIPTKDFERIQTNKGGLLSIIQFLSTSTTRDVAEVFTFGAPDGDSGLLFHITIDQSMSRTISYANIKEYSKFKDEDEYLLTMGSVFRIESIEQLDTDNRWCVHLSLTSDNDVELTSLTDYYRKFLKSPTLLSLSFVMFTMGEYEKVVQICETGVKTIKSMVDINLFYFQGSQRPDFSQRKNYSDMTFPTGKIRTLRSLYFQWSVACFQMGYKRQALKILEQALSYGEQLFMFNEFASLRLLMKALHSFMQGEYDLAVSLSQECIDLEQKNPNPECHKEIVSVCHQMIGYINQCQGNFDGALPYYTAAYQTMHEHLPSLHPLISSCLQDSSICHLAIGEKGRSLSLIKQAKNISERTMLTEDLLAVKSDLIEEVLGSDSVYDQESILSHSDRGQSEIPQNPMRLFQQAARYTTQKRFDEALSTIDELLRLQEQTNSLFDSDIINVYLIQGYCRLNKGNFMEALESFRKAEHIATSTKEQLRHRMSGILLWIAVCHAEQKNDSQAMNIIEQCCKMVSSGIQLNSYRLNQEALDWIIVSFRRRGMDHQTRDEYQEAVSTLEKCLKIQQMVLSDDHLDHAEIYSAIGDCFRKMENYSCALINYQKALVIYEKSLPSNDLQIIKIWFLMGGLHGLMDQNDKALAAFTKHCQLVSSVDPPNYSELADSYQYIATVFFNQANLVDAVANYQRSLDIYAKYSLPTNLKTAMIWMNLGYIYSSQKQNDDALSAFNTALDIQMSTSTPNLEHLASIHERVGVLHRRAEKYPEALSSFQNCLQIQMSILPADHLALGETLSSIGEMNFELKRFSDAVKCYENATHIQIKYLPETTSEVISNFKNSASCYFRLLDWENFIAVNEKALEFQLNILPAYHLDIAQTYRQLGMVYYLWNDYEEALENYLKCLDIQMASLPSDDPRLLATRAEIDEISEYTEVRSSCEQSLEIQKIALPPNHIDTVQSNNKVGCVYPNMGEYTKALAYYERVLETQKKLLPLNHPDIAESYGNIGLLYSEMGDYSKALLYHERSVEIKEIALPANHSDLATDYNIIGTLCATMGEYSKALKYFERTLEIQKVALSTNHPDIAESCGNIGKVYSEMGEYSKALSYHERSLEIKEIVLPANHPDLATDYNIIGMLCVIMDEYSKALKYFERTLEIQKVALPTNHPDFVESYENIGEMYCQIGEHSKALTYFEQSLEIQKVALSTNHPDIAESYDNIGKMYSEMGEYSKALSYHERSLEIKEIVLPANHPDLATDYNIIGTLCATIGEYSKALSYYRKAKEIWGKSLPSNHPHLALVEQKIESVKKQLH